MPDTVERRRAARVNDNLKIALKELLDAELEVTGREDAQARSIRNAVQATRFALKGRRPPRGTVVAPVTTPGPEALK